MKSLRAFAAAILLVFGVAAQAAPFNKETAPDRISQHILTRTLTKIHEGAPTGLDPSPTIHRNFPQIIEQNFARLDAHGMATLLDAMTEAELSDLAQLYVNAITDHGLPPKLLYAIAHRLDAQRLGRVSRHFGFAQVYAAVTAMAPDKTQRFIESTQTGYEGPRPGELRFGPDGLFAPAKLTTSAGITPVSFVLPSRFTRGDMRKVAGGGFGQFLNYTPYEIYLSFRTAPVGALGVSGALWETSVVLSATLTVSYGTGYAIGNFVVAPLIQTYAPSLWNSIGAGVAGAVNTLSNSWLGGLTTMGTAQQSTAATFQVNTQQTAEFIEYGGDYGAAAAWSVMVTSGCGRTVCPRPN